MERDRKEHILERFKTFFVLKQYTTTSMHTHMNKHANIKLAYFLLRFQLNSSAENEALKQKE